MSESASEEDLKALAGSHDLFERISLTLSQPGIDATVVQAVVLQQRTYAAIILCSIIQLPARTHALLHYRCQQTLLCLLQLLSMEMVVL